jgi:hypothetical protein
MLLRVDVKTDHENRKARGLIAFVTFMRRRETQAIIAMRI